MASPFAVSRCTGQPGSTCSVNQVSAHPFSTHLLTVSAFVRWPSASKSGNLLPAEPSPLIRYRRAAASGLRGLRNTSDGRPRGNRDLPEIVLPTMTPPCSQKTNIFPKPDLFGPFFASHCDSLTLQYRPGKRMGRQHKAVTFQNRIPEPMAVGNRGQKRDVLAEPGHAA